MVNRKQTQLAHKQKNRRITTQHKHNINTKRKQQKQRTKPQRIQTHAQNKQIRKTNNTYK